jgi:hypothetical protein
MALALVTNVGEADIEQRGNTIVISHKDLVCEFTHNQSLQPVVAVAPVNALLAMQVVPNTTALLGISGLAEDEFGITKELICSYVLPVRAEFVEKLKQEWAKSTQGTRKRPREERGEDEIELQM